MLKLKLFLVSWNHDGFTLAESRTRKSGTVAPLVLILANLQNVSQN